MRVKIKISIMAEIFFRELVITSHRTISNMRVESKKFAELISQTQSNRKPGFGPLEISEIICAYLICSAQFAQKIARSQTAIEFIAYHFPSLCIHVLRRNNAEEN